MVEVKAVIDVYVRACFCGNVDFIQQVAPEE